MKTKKYSNSMKALVTLGIMLMISSAAFSQVVEERKGGMSTYSVTAGATTDDFTWTIEAAVAPAVVPLPSSGLGIPGDPFIIDWTSELNSIQVTWAADASPDTIATAGVVTVQKRTTVGTTCPSPLQTMDISFWSQPSATIASADIPVCSTDPIGGSITIDLTGAPDDGESGNDGFVVAYNVAVSDPTLTVTGLVGQPGAGTVTSDNATVTIPLPDALVNVDTDPQDYTITLTTIDDDLDDGPHVVAAQVYTITVYPTPATGIIQSTGALTRR